MVPEKVAAIDLGSNSFHMVVARFDGGELQPIERIGEKVQLGRGMVAGRLSDDAIERGVDCLSRFAQRLKELPQDAVRVVGTNALRAAKNGAVFLERAEQVLGCPVEVIAGREEARLVYLGVSHTLGDDSQQRLVIDIGGGSTELIIGERFEARVMESLHMGCVSFMQRYFGDGQIDEQRYTQAYQAACLELLQIKERYLEHGWASCVGSSGTLQAVEQVLLAQGFSDGGIDRKGLAKLRKALLNFQRIDEVKFDGLKENRRTVFASGLAIVQALFDTLDIETMSISSGALREGVLYDLVGRLDHEDVRERTVSALEQRYDIDARLGNRVAELALLAWSQVKASWQLDDENAEQKLRWAGRLHEVGMAISHSSFHKHGEYILSQSDLAGFSRPQQQALSMLVRGHRRKFPMAVFAEAGSRRQRLERLCILLRLAVILKHSEPPEGMPHIEIEAKDSKVELRFPASWLAAHPLTAAELEREVQYLKKPGYQLVVT